eukprot:CAMPEP_0113644358 /NCGR_PEP_ID=MMETSP0017_2-20120614/23347_1 /TAXON_ID=2856 /ORGANISM="Cylindrotheca closterium" /LENGTH=300 /DNA_ID=CAMNT_0000555967 /DNA_START=142 /DNA_END=1044 /DNA_ORIENTATION=+ /assembly_acc=CAM_ASM_000147
MSSIISASQQQQPQPQTTEFQEVPITKDETPRNSENSISTASLTAMSSSVVEEEEELSWTSEQAIDDDSDNDDSNDEPDVQELLDIFDTLDTIQVGRELAESPNKIFKRQSSSNNKGVRFSTVQIREYPIEIGDNPSGDSGPPITIGWEHTREMEVSVDHNENYGYNADEKSVSSDKKRRIKRNVHGLHLSHLKRMCKLHHSGYSSQEIGAATQAANNERRKREETLKSLKNEKLNEYKETVKRAIRNATVARKAKKAEKAFLKPFVERCSKNRHSSIINQSGELPNAKTYEDDGGFWYY